MKITIFSGALLFALFVGTHVVNGVDLYSMSNFYFDEVATAYCAAKGWTNWWAMAIRRNPTPQINCHVICRKLSQGNNIVYCYNTIHFPKNHRWLRANPTTPHPDAGVVGMEVKPMGYWGCWQRYREPNYCCCRVVRRLKRRTSVVINDVIRAQSEAKPEEQLEAQNEEEKAPEAK